jgi:hypothetical protein
LLHDLFDFTKTEFHIRIGKETSQVMFTEIKDEVESGFKLVHLGGFRSANFYQIDNILMFEQLEDADLSQGSNGELLEE